MLDRSRAISRIDTALLSQTKVEIQYWKNVLRRVVAVIKKLSSLRLAFKGHDERFRSVHNGNFMMSLELIAEFDPFLAEHTATYGNPDREITSYLSSTTCDEFIKLMGKRVQDAIVGEIKKYYFIIVDSTPDISHVDQLSVIFRYVNSNGISLLFTKSWSQIRQIGGCSHLIVGQCWHRYEKL